MKLFAFAMALLVLTLSCMPCADGVCAADNGKAKTLLSKTPGNSDDHTDDCSPFCTCNCCAGFTVNLMSFQIAVNVSPLLSKDTKHLPQTICNISLPVWQPPQLV